MVLGPNPERPVEPSVVVLIFIQTIGLQIFPLYYFMVLIPLLVMEFTLRLS